MLSIISSLIRKFVEKIATYTTEGDPIFKKIKAAYDLLEGDQKGERSSDVSDNNLKVCINYLTPISMVINSRISGYKREGKIDIAKLFEQLKVLYLAILKSAKKTRLVSEVDEREKLIDNTWNELKTAKELYEDKIGPVIEKYYKSK